MEEGNDLVTGQASGQVDVLDHAGGPALLVDVVDSLHAELLGGRVAALGYLDPDEEITGAGGRGPPFRAGTWTGAGAAGSGPPRRGAVPDGPVPLGGSAGRLRGGHVGDAGEGLTARTADRGPLATVS